MPSNFIYHYVYRITNLVENRHYYGARSCKNKSPSDDLGTRYFSSSKDKDFIKDQKQNPTHYKYKVVRTCISRKSALEFEIFLHKKFQVSSNEKFYNLACQTSSKFSAAGMKFPKGHSVGKNNSQHGTFWIHNKEQKKNIKIKQGEEIPVGWEKGRVCDWSRAQKISEKRKEKDQNRILKEQLAIEQAYSLFYDFMNSKHNSILSFSTECSISQPAISGKFNKYIKGYSDISFRRVQNIKDKIIKNLDKLSGLEFLNWDSSAFEADRVSN